MTDTWSRAGDACAGWGKWNRFWFRPASPRAACRLRIVVGLFALTWLCQVSAAWDEWFAANGLLPRSTVVRVLATDSHGGRDRALSLWDRIATAGDSKWLLGLTFCSVTAFTCGALTPLAGLGSFLGIVAIIHRAPMMFGPFEHVLAVAVGYLTLAPSGRFLSVDRWVKGKIRGSEVCGPEACTRTNIAMRLWQIHLGMIYLFAGMSKLVSDVWWQGEGVWWLAVQPESTLADLTWIGRHPLLMNLWTYLIVATELAMGSIVWFRPVRPLLVGLSGIVWISLIPLTGQLGYCGLMCVLNTVFLTQTSPSLIRR